MNPEAVFDALLEASGRAVLVAGLVATALAVFRAKAPAVRHAVWTATLATMLTLPLVSGWLPTVQIPRWEPEPSSLERLAASYGPVSLVLHAIPVFPSTPSSLPVPVGAALTPGPAGQPSATRPTSAPPAATTQDWRTNAVLLWAIVAGILLLREAMGWRLARRLAVQGIPAGIGDGTYESERVMTPVVTGVLRPRLLVPSSWSQWGSGVRRMVLAHERAHVARRDPLVAALARVNRSVFWFHPLAWWLERHLARLAERACDEVVVRELQDSRLYAALLVEMAHRLKKHGQRVAWQGIGVVGSRRLEDRIDHLLSGPSPQPSRSQKLALAAVSTSLIAVAVACGTSAAPLAEDPELAKEIAASEARSGESRPAVMTTVDDLPSLEKAVTDNPADMAATRRLIGFYRNHGQKVLGWDRMVTGLRPHLLRLIERDPESQQSYWTLTRAQDPEGYAQARALWMAHVDKPNASSLVLAQAAEFFSREEQFVAEELLLRGKQADPGGPTVLDNGRKVSRGPWYTRLGRLYAKGVLGVTDGVFGVISASDPVAANGPFAQHARRVLSSTNDARMLVSAGTFMFYNARDLKLDYDHRAVAREYVRRAAAINPGGAAPAVLERFDSISRHNSDWDEMVRVLGTSSSEVTDAVFDGLSDDLKLRYANGLIWGPHGDLMEAYQRKDNSAIQLALTSFERRARHMLDVVSRATQSNPNSRVAADAHIALGTAAMRRGKVADAVKHLQQAGLAGRPMEKVDGRNDDTNSLGSVSAARLTHELLDAGERETVAAFYETAARTLVDQQRLEYETAASAIRAGRMPENYQRYLARLK